MSEQRRLAAIMFTDVCGFSSIMGSDEERALAIVEMHKNCVADGARIHGGRIAKEMGDGLLVEFPSAVNAVRCALAVQRAISDFNKTADPGEKFQLRIGIHVGDVVVAGDDILGDGVNVASRIEPLAEPGGICISRDIFDLVRNKISIETVHLGAHDLKNISRQVSIYKVLIDAVAPGTIRSPKIQKPRRMLKYAMIAAFVISLLAGGITLKKQFPRTAPATPPTVREQTPESPLAVRPGTGQRLPNALEDTLRERHIMFLKAVLDKNRQEALDFVSPQVLANGDPDMIWRRMALVAGVLQAGLRSRDDLRLKAVNISDNGESAEILMQYRKPALNRKPELWSDMKPINWKRIGDAWYLDIAMHPDAAPLVDTRPVERRRLDEYGRDAIPRERRLPRQDPP